MLECDEWSELYDECFVEAFLRRTLLSEEEPKYTQLLVVELKHKLLAVELECKQLTVEEVECKYVTLTVVEVVCKILAVEEVECSLFAGQVSTVS